MALKLQLFHKVEHLDGELKDAFADLLSLHPPDEVQQRRDTRNGSWSSDRTSTGKGHALLIRHVMTSRVTVTSCDVNSRSNNWEPSQYFPELK